jgi:putative transposase
MRSVIVSLLLTLCASLRDRAALQLEILALRHQLQVLERTRPRHVRLNRADRLLWVWLSRVWPGWRPAVVIVKPQTVLA